MGAFTERWYPLALGLAAGVGSFYWLRESALLPGTKDLLAAFLNVAAIVVGFLVTTKSILISIDDRWIIQRAREAGAYEMLLGYLVSATYWWLGLAVLSAVGLAIVPASLADADHAVAVKLFAAWTMVAVTSALAAVRVLKIFSTILRSIGKNA